MKMMRRSFCLMLVLMLCLSMAVPVFAAVNSDSGSKQAGLYLTLRGSYSVDLTRNTLNTTTTIGKNLDEARLCVTIDFSNGSYHFGNIVKMSERSALSLMYNPVIPYAGTAPNYVYTCHEVRDGTVEDAYAVYCEGALALG